MPEDVKPKAGPRTRSGVAEVFALAIIEAPYAQKIKYVNALVAAAALERGGIHVADWGEAARVGAELSRTYLAGRMTDGERARLTTDFTEAVWAIALRRPGRKARRGASTARESRPVETADPIEHYRGEYVHEATDLVIDGAGLDFAFHRTYRHQTIYDGPLGQRWDHGYNLFLSIDEVRASLWTGTGREETYLRHARWGQAGFDYYVPPDGVHATIEPLGSPTAPSGWMRRAPDGLRHVFEPEPDWSGGFRLARIEDRWGNYLRFAYVDGRLDRCYVNHAERWVRFAYDADGRIVRVADFTGRAWRYIYDAHGDLIYVVTPATPSSPRGDVTEYRYATGTHPRGPLAHNLTDVFDGEGRHYLHNRYGIDPGTEDFNRIVYQRLGNGVFQLRYGAVDPGSADPLAASDRPAMRCWVKERNGYQTLHVYNGAGNLLRKEETHRPEGGRSERVAWRYRHNRDGALVAARSPEGCVEQVLTGRDHFYRVHGIEPRMPGAEDDLWRHPALTAAARRAFGHTLATIRRARLYRGPTFEWNERWGDDHGADAADIVVKYTYEPAYGQILTVSDPRTTTSPDPRALEPPMYDRHLTRRRYDGPQGDETRDLVEILAPALTRADGTAAPPVFSTILERDARGRIVLERGPGGTITRTERYPETAGARAGYVRRVTVDPGDHAVGRLDLVTAYDVDELGRVVAITRPRGVRSGDGRFVERATYDALDRVTASRRATPLDDETRTRFEAAGKPKHVESDWRDPRDAPGSAREPVVHRFRYDEEHRVVTHTTGGADLAGHVRVVNRYDAAGNLRATIAANDTSTHHRHDPRDQLVRTIRAFGVEGEAATTLVRDRDGRVVASRSGEGRTETFELDAFGRSVAITDALGHVTRTSYDKAGRATVTRRFECRADGSYWLVARHERRYDELGRAVEDVANRFDTPLAATDLAQDHEASPGPGRRLVTRTDYDGDGRVVALTDPLGWSTRTEYDAAGRLRRTTEATGDRTELQLDEHGNVIRRDRIDVVRDVDGNVVGTEVLSWEGAYDERDRLVAERDGLGNTTRYEHDSFDRLVRRRDALGNVVEIDHDVHGRVVATTERRTASGLGDGAPLPPAVIRYEHDRSGQVVARIDALGRRTAYRRDRANRIVEETLPDGARITTQYDRDDLVVSVRDAHGVVVRHTYDGVGRIVRSDVDETAADAGTAVEGARLVERTYDGMHRLVSARTDAVALSWRYDSTGNANAEEMVVHGVGGAALRLARGFDGTGRVETLQHAGGRELRLARDEAGRLREILHVHDGDDFPGHGGVGLRPLVRLARAGARLRDIAMSNGASTTYRHDAAGRTSEVEHRARGETLLRAQHLRDAVANPRRRIEEGPSGAAERYAYDAQYQLCARVSDPDAMPVDVGVFAPPAGRATTPVGQLRIDAAIGAFVAPGVIAGDRWTYDLVGNRRSAIDDASAPRLYEPDERDRYVAVGGEARIYDRAGNLRADARFEYRYDAWRRLCAVLERGTGSVVARYRYDALGRRVVEEDEGDELLVIAYDRDERVADYRRGACVAQYVHAEGAGPVHVAVDGGDHWYHRDLQASVRVLTDADGEVSARYRYDAFGALRESAGTALGSPPLDGTAQPFGFGARAFDAVTGYYDHRARTYAPADGRFLQRDPAGPVDGRSLYAFAGNNPLAFGDPSGLAREEHDAHAGHRDAIEPQPFEPITPSSWYERLDRFVGDEIVPRAGGVLRLGAGIYGTSVGAGLCATGIGCLVGAPIGLFSADQAIAGGVTTVTGDYQASTAERILRRFMSEDRARELVEIAQGGIAAGGYAREPYRVSPPPRSPRTVIPRGEPTTPPPPEPVTRLYHGGLLRGGKVEPRRISLTTEREHAEQYARQRNGRVFEFRVPTRRLYEMQRSGRATTSLDRHEVSGSAGYEWRILGDAAEELNKYMSPADDAPLPPR